LFVAAMTNILFIRMATPTNSNTSAPAVVTAASRRKSRRLSSDGSIIQTPPLVPSSIRDTARETPKSSSVFYLGANNDIQRLLANNKTRHIVAENNAHYKQFSRVLAVLGMLGLEQDAGADHCIKYTTGYACKGGKSTLDISSALFHFR
jgi:hypothetical protein